MREKFEDELVEGSGLNETELSILITGLQLLYAKEAAAYPRSRFLKIYRKLEGKLVAAI